MTTDTHLELAGEMARRLLGKGWDRTAILVVLRVKYGLGPIAGDDVIDRALAQLDR